MHFVQRIVYVSSQINAVTTLGCSHYNKMPLAEICNARNWQVPCSAGLDRHVLHSRHVRRQAGHCSIPRSLHRKRRQCTLCCVGCSASQSPLQISESTWLQSFVEWLHGNRVTGLIQPDAKLALYEAEDKAGPAERGVIFTGVCQPIQIYTRCSLISLTPEMIQMTDQRPYGDAPSSITDCETAL